MGTPDNRIQKQLGVRRQCTTPNLKFCDSAIVYDMTILSSISQWSWKMDYFKVLIWQDRILFTTKGMLLIQYIVVDPILLFPSNHLFCVTQHEGLINSAAEYCSRIWLNITNTRELFVVLIQLYVPYIS